MLLYVEITYLKGIKMETNILLYIQENLRFDFLTPIMIFLTYLGDAGIVWIVLSVLFLIFKKTRKTGIMTSTALIFDLLTVNVFLKNLVARTRPYEVIEGLTILIEKQSDFSFPSGHTAASFGFVSVLWFSKNKKLWAPLTLLAILISYTRLYVGVHYMTDVLGGALVGTLCGFFAVLVVNFIEKKIKKSA